MQSKNTVLPTSYANCLKINGLIFIFNGVKDLYSCLVAKLDEQTIFERVPEIKLIDAPKLAVYEKQVRSE